MLALARHAMNCRFELLLHGGNAVALRAAAEEALDEISRLESQLSAYSRFSELTQINTRAAREPVRVEPQLFRLLQHAQQLHAATHGAFDITIGPLMRAWGFVRKTGKLPDAASLENARAVTGMGHVHLDADAFTVRFDREGVMLDLGAIGKGCALDRAVAVLREAGVTGAMLHGGTSSVATIGRDANGQPWRIGIARPETEFAVRGILSKPGDGRTGELLATVELEDESLSVSAVWGKGFEAEGKFFGHVLDPRTGSPADLAVLAALVVPCATEADALSTAMLTLGPESLDLLAWLWPGCRSLIATRDGEGSIAVHQRRFVVTR